VSVRVALERDSHHEDVEDLPVIELGEPSGDAAWPEDRLQDRGAFEDRYAQLAFGLGTVPRRVHRDDPWWQTPTGLLVAVAVLLLLLLASA